MKRRNRQIEKAKKKKKDSQRAQVHRILDLAMDVNEGGNTTFFRFDGHTNGVAVYIHDGHWKPGEFPELELQAYIGKTYGHKIIRTGGGIMPEIENRMVIDSEWGETDYGVKTDRDQCWDNLPDECFEEE